MQHPFLPNNSPGILAPLSPPVFAFFFQSPWELSSCAFTWFAIFGNKRQVFFFFHTLTSQLNSFSFHYIFLDQFLNILLPPLIFFFFFYCGVHNITNCRHTSLPPATCALGLGCFLSLAKSKLGLKKKKKVT